MTKLGVRIANTGPQPAALGLTEMGRAAEAAGADTLHVQDHVVLLDDMQSRYPFTEDGRFPWDARSDHYEVLASCGWLAAVTTRCEVGASVLVLPQRNALEVAKVAATIDQLSGGRLFLGVGAGWLAEEFDALGHDFAGRGPRLDEQIDVLRIAWSGSGAGYRADQVTIPEGVQCRPLPARPGGVPILVGGMSKVALRRAVAKGDGWVGLVPAEEAAAEAVVPKLRSLERLLGEAGRDHAGFRAAVKLASRGPASLERLPKMVAMLAAEGFDEVVVDPMWRELQEAEEVVAACRQAIDAGKTPTKPVTVP